MGENGVVPNSVTYNIVVKGLCKEGKMEEAIETIRKMEEKGYAPNCKGLKMDVVAVNTILHSLCKEKNLDEAFKLLRCASKRGYDLDEVSYGNEAEVGAQGFQMNLKPGIHMLLV
ncbi:hypothetical protein Sjap_015252 [Stephania japonica]|uniref:Pentatricopeptide repeat-containing protein n=1 Tax=Stephania japonica TaxID=461633 RepID=A0AAP0NSP6_9MAGN